MTCVYTKLFPFPLWALFFKPGRSDEEKKWNQFLTTDVNMSRCKEGERINPMLNIWTDWFFISNNSVRLSSVIKYVMRGNLLRLGGVQEGIKIMRLEHTTRWIHLLSLDTETWAMRAKRKFMQICIHINFYEKSKHFSFKNPPWIIESTQKLRFPKLYVDTQRSVHRWFSAEIQHTNRSESDKKSEIICTRIMYGMDDDTIHKPKNTLM